MRFDLDKDDDLAFVHTTSRHLLHYIPPTPEIYGSWSFLKIYHVAQTKPKTEEVMESSPSLVNIE